MMDATHEKLGAYAEFPEEATRGTAPSPPAFFEYAWYVILAYAMLGKAWGVVVPSVGGALLAVLAAACFFSVGAKISRVYAPVALALCTGISAIAVQYFFHSERSFDDSIVFIGWLCTLIIVQALSLRPGFLHRFALAAFVIGLGVIPYIEVGGSAGLTRVWASGTGIANPNSLGMWFGFSAIYFVFWGLESQNRHLRVVSWAVALGSLYMVALTVSRGPLLGIILACVVGLRSALKRSFFPILSLVVLIGLVYESGIFGQAIDSYIARGAEETGRGKLWPMALERFINSPWTGVGLGDIYIPTSSRLVSTPHNALLYIGLAAGIIPAICFLGYLARAVGGTLHIMRKASAGESMLLPPLVIFALIETMILDAAFMSAWVVVVFAFAIMKRSPVRET